MKKEWYHKMIDMAYANRDSDEVVQVYLDILDYDVADLDISHIKKVLESLSYEKRIDHHLYDHLIK
jgi:hypothetical protein